MVAMKIWSPTTKGAGYSPLTVTQSPTNLFHLNCIACERPSRENSIYCSDNCVQMYASKLVVGVTATTASNGNGPNELLLVCNHK